ncbi:hypothetical protein LJC34_07090, partial [Oscillospiraceae bacterium OttesenSCG-928-G22]|nr:hypothetical protein [Oscillospiraceae bacterium OttesenSCG-928-G22]
MKRKLLGILLVIALVTALIPAGALAAPERIDVTFSYSKGSSIVLGPVEISVHAGLASEYGVGSASTSPTVLDAVVAAHKIRYGDDFTQATAADYVNAGLTALFGDSGYGGHIINGNYSSDAASSAVLRAGDAVDTLLYDALTWGDYHAAFYRNDMLTRELAAEVGETVALTVKGFNIMMGSSSSARVAMPNLDVGTIDPSSGLFTTKHLTTDSEGRVTVSFDAAGTYILATNGPSNSNPVVPAWCAVTVTAATSPEEQARFIAEDKDALDVTYTDGQNLSLPTKGSSGRTMISWTSSEPAVIGDTGVVNKQMTERSVTLTATISCGSAEPQTKTFSITVPALTSFEISEKLAAAKGALTPLSLAPVEFSGLDGGSYPYEGSEAVDTNILTKARGIVNAAAPGVSVALSDSFTGDAYVAADGTIRYPSTSGPHYAEVTFALSLGGETQEKRVTAIEISKHAKTKAEAIQTAMDALTISDLLNNNPDENSITTTLKLPVGKTVGIKTDWSSDNPAVTVGTGTSSSTGQLHTILRPSPAEGDATVSLTATFDYAAMSIQYGICDAGPMPALAERQKTFTIKVPALSQSEYDAQRKLLLDGIAEDKARINNMTDDPNLPWLVSDLLAYRTAYPSTPYVISDANIRKDLDAIVNNAAATNLPGDLAKYIIALRALGYDARSTVASDGIARDIVKKLTDLVDAKDPGVTGLYTLPYVLTALQQHSTYATQAQIDYLIQSALNSADATGGWGGEFYFEDATATMVSALAAYYDTNGSVKAAIDKALSRLENAQNPDGTLGGYPDNKYNAAATGLAIAAFVSVGRDPAAVQNAGRSLVDGLYLFRNTGGYAFTPTDSSFATEQGFRGLLSADRFAASEAAYRIYDFSANDMNAATASPAQYCPVVFSLNPAGAALVLTKGGVSQAEAYPGVYDLDAGTYSYSVTKSGYETKTGTFPVTADDAATHTRKEISVSLSAVQTGGTSDISVDVYVKTHGGGCNNAYTYKSNSGKFTNLASGTVTLDAGSSVFDAIDKLLSREQ